MSKSIDERVVRMDFENDSFERKAAKSTKTVKELDKALELKNGKKSFEDVEAAAEKTNFSSLIKAADVVTNRLSNLGIVGVTALSNLTNKAVDAGEKLVKSLTIDQVMAGWNKMDQITKSTGTLVSQGYDLSNVESQLDKLNWFTDETSYNLSSMIENIAKFTATGQNLDESAVAMEGIALWAALSGQNASTAERAMYQLSQALGAGYMRLEDYRSIQNASMDTDEFRQKALDAAVALGTLQDNLDGTYTSLVNGGDAFTKSQFAQSLTEGAWFTSDVMMEVYRNYASAVDQIYNYAKEKGITTSQAIEELGDKVDSFGLKAFRAGQEARSFGDAIDAAKDAVSTGWMKTFKIIFGNYDQQRVLWTDLANSLYEIFASGGEARNELLKAWSNLGGRDDFIKGLYNSLGAIVERGELLKETFGEVFPSLTPERLAEITKSFAEISESFKMGDEEAGKLKRAFSGVLNVFKKAGNIAGSFVKSLSPLTKLGSYLGGLALNGLASFGDKLTELSKISSKVDIFGGIEKGVDFLVNKFINTTEAVKTFFQTLEKPKLPDFSGMFSSFNISGALASAGSFLNQVFSGLGSGLSNAFNGFSFDNLLKNITTGAFAALVINLTKFVDKIKELFDSLGDVVGNVVGEDGVLGILKETLKSFQTEIKSKTLINIATAVGILAASLLVLSMVKPERLAVALGALSGSMVGLVKMVSALGTMMAAGDFKGFAKLTMSLIPLSVAILILASAVAKLSRLDWNGLLIGLAGLAGIALVISKTASYLSSSVKGLKISALGFIGLATAIVILASAVSSMGKLDFGQLVNGLLGVAVSLAVIARFTEISDVSKISIKTGLALIAIAAAMNIFASAVSKLGTMDSTQALDGIFAMGGILLAIASFSEVMNKFSSGNMISLGASLILIGAAMNILSVALGSMGKMGFEQIGKGLLAMGVGLLILADAMERFGKAKNGVGAMILAASALLLLTPSLLLLGNMSLSKIVVGLLAIAGAFTIFGVAGSLLKPLAPTILILSGALALMGVGILATGSGVMVLAAGITALAAAFAAGGGLIVEGITAILTGIVEMIPTVATALAQGITAFASAIATGVPTFAAVGIALIMSFLMSIRTIIPAIVTVGLEMIVSLLSGLNANIGDIITVGVQLVINLINGIASSLGALIQAGINLAIAFVNGVANGIRDNSEQIFAAVRNLLSSILELFIDGLQEVVSLIPGVGSKMAEGLESAKEAIRETLAPESMSEIGSEAAQSLSNGAVNGINIESIGSGLSAQLTTAAGSVDVSSAGEILGNNFSDSVATSMVSGTNLYSVRQSGVTLTNEANDGGQSVDTTVTGAYIVQGIVQGINDNAWLAYAAAEELAQQCSNIINNSLKINSPSKVTYKSGSGIVEGLALGIDENAPLAYSSVESLANRTIKTFSAALDGANDLTPARITPVLDMSEIYNAMSDFGVNDEEWNPVIRPILDMSRVNPGLKNLRAIIANKAEMMNRAENQNGSTVNNASNSMVFNQYNYSPKALNRVEIYRQTNNQFAAMKGLVRSKV